MDKQAYFANPNMEKSYIFQIKPYFFQLTLIEINESKKPTLLSYG